MTRMSEIPPELLAEMTPAVRVYVEPLRYQVWELPVIEPIIIESQRHRLSCPGCGTTTCAALSAGVPKPNGDDFVVSIFGLGSSVLPEIDNSPFESGVGLPAGLVKQVRRLLLLTRHCALPENVRMKTRNQGSSLHRRCSTGDHKS